VGQLTVSLSSADLRALQSVHDALLDPLSHETTEEWLLEVCARFERLCHGAASMAGAAPRGKPPRFVSPELPQGALDRMAELSCKPGTMRTDDSCVEGLMEGLRQRVSGVATTADLLGPGGISPGQLRESPIFRDVAFPLGVPGSAVLLHSGASGEYLIHSSWPEVERRPFGHDTAQVLESLLPGFAAGIGALDRLGNARRAIAVLLDALDDGALIFDATARRVLARNGALGVLVQKEPDLRGLEFNIAQSALAALRGSGPPRDVGGPDPGALSRGWRSATGQCYRLRAIRLPAGSVARDEAILVLIQRVGPRIPDPDELMRRYRLTRREAEVAHRLAYGRSDREIADELHLSPHTVRHHAESVFVKTGVTTRKALALHLSTI
jgi:DNA-binding CsgD family transcriptional regulator